MQSDAENKALCVVPTKTHFSEKRKKRRPFGRPANRLEEQTKENTGLPRQTLESNSLEQEEMLKLREQEMHKGLFGIR